MIEEFHTSGYGGKATCCELIEKMSYPLKQLLIFILTVALCAEPASAACKIDVSKYVGWTIVYSGTVTGFIDDNGEKKDNFEGCKYGRVLIVDYDKAVTCDGYNYSYAYNPDIVVLSRKNMMKACIDNDLYDIHG